MPRRFNKEDLLELALILFFMGVGVLLGWLIWGMK